VTANLTKAAIDALAFIEVTGWHRPGLKPSTRSQITLLYTCDTENEGRCWKLKPEAFKLVKDHPMVIKARKARAAGFRMKSPLRESRRTGKMIVRKMVEFVDSDGREFWLWADGTNVGELR
jgi:hypothetical protein